MGLIDKFKSRRGRSRLNLRRIGSWCEGISLNEKEL